MRERKIPASAIEDLQRVLGEAPQRHRREFNQKQAVRLLFPEIRAMQTKGYNLTEIAQVLSERGLEVTPMTLRTLLSIFRCAAEKGLGQRLARDSKDVLEIANQPTANQPTGLPTKAQERSRASKQSATGATGKDKGEVAVHAAGAAAVASVSSKRSSTATTPERLPRPGTFIPREDSDEI